MKEYGVSTDTIDYLFASTTANSQAKLDSLAATILGQGIDFYQAGKYDQAINAFKRSAALSPASDNSAKSYDFIGQSYLKQEKTDLAIKTYQEAIRLYPARSEFHVSLGDIYLQQNMQDEALKQYEAAVKLDPQNAESRYTLGQSYLSAGALDNAREQFAAVANLTPSSAVGFYGLGQVARAEGNYEEAVSQLSKAISVNKDFEIAYVELAYTYADRGQFDQANNQLAILKAKNSDKTTAVQNYIDQVTAPRFVTARGIKGFYPSFDAGTKVSDLDTKLQSAGTSKIFSMKFTFSKDMDAASVINPKNWTISRATIQNNGGVYNYGKVPPATEAFIKSIPTYVKYNADNNTALVYFRVDQNATADATIDPKHIVFKFSGVDAYGKAMDSSADEYIGFRGVA